MLSDKFAKVTDEHLKRKAYLYVRQSTVQQVQQNRESLQRQYALKEWALPLGWPLDRIEIIDSDLGRSGSSAQERDGLAAVQTELKDRIPDDLSAERRAKLLAEMLDSRPANLIAEEVIMGLPDSMLEEVADWPAQTLLYGLFLRVNDCLMDHMAQGITEWYGEKLLERAEKGLLSLRALRSPAETARWLTAKMADESPGGMFCRPGEPAVACPDEVERSIYRIADTAALMIFIKTKKIEGQVH